MKPRVLKWVVMLCISTLLTVAAQEARAAVPETIQYSGALSIEGEPMEGRADLRFELYHSESGGTAIWTEASPQQSITAGRFTVELGDRTPLEPVLDGRQLWLEVSVNGVTLTPRQMVSSTPYAFRAADAATIGGQAPSEFLSADATIDAGDVRFTDAGGESFEVGSALNQIFTELSSLRDTITSQDSELAALRSELDSVSLENEQLVTRLELVEGWSDEATLALAANEMAAAEAQSAADSALSSFAGLETAFTGQQTEFSAAQGDIAQLQQDLLAAQSSLSSFDDDVSGLRSSVTDLQSGFDDMSLLTSGHSSAMASLQDDLSELVTEVSDAQDAIAGLETEIDNLDPDDVSDRLGSLEAEFDELSTTSDDLRADVESSLLQVSAFDSRLSDAEDNFDAQLSAHSQQIQSLQSGVSSLNGSVGQLTTYYGNVADYLDDLDIWRLNQEMLVGAQASMLDDLDNDLGELASDVAQHGGELTSLGSSFSALNSIVDDMGDDVSVLNASFSSLSSDHADLSSDFAGLSSDFGDLSGDLAGLSSDFAGLSSDVNGLSSDLSAVTADVAGLVSGDYSDRLSDLEEWRVEDVDTQLASFASLPAEVSQLQSTVSDIEDAGLDSRLANVESSFGNLNSTVGQLVSHSSSVSDYLDDLDIWRLNKDMVVGAHATMLDDLDNDLNSLSSDLSGLSSDFGGLSSDLSGLSSDFGDLSSDLSGLSSDLSGLSSDLSGLSSDFGGLGSDFGELQSAFAALDGADLPGRVTGLEGTVSDHGSALASTQSDLSAVEGDLSSLQSSFGSVQSSVSGMQSTLTGLQSGVSALSGDVSAHSGSISSLETAVGQLSTWRAEDVDPDLSSLRSLPGTVSLMQSSVTSLETEVGDLQSDYSGLASSVSNLEDEVGGFDSAIGALESDVGDLQDELGDFSSDFSELAYDVDSLEFTVDYMQLNLGNLMGDVADLEEWQEDTVDPALVTLATLNTAQLPNRVGQLETDVIGLDSDFGSLESFVYSELGDLEDDVSSLTTTVSGIGDDVSDLNTWKLSAEATLIAHNTRITDIEDWRTDYADDAIEYDIPELLERTQYQRAELVGGLPGLIFEGTNVYVRSGNADYLGNDSCRPAPPVAMGEPGGGEHHVIQGAPVRTKISDGGGPCYRDPINGELCEDEVISESCDLYDQEGAGLGNLVIGYGKPTYDDSLISGGMDDDDLDNGFKHGMHNLVIGLGHDWRATYGILHGNHHILGQDYAAIVGGRENFLEHQYTSGTFEHQGAAIFGGWGNYVYTNMATLVGGYYHQAWDLEWGEAEFGSLDGD